VPTGPVQSWHHEPFSGKVVDGVLHGRGAADMKGSLAAMLTATKSFLSETPEPEGSIGFLITSDEEDKAINGTRKVMELLQSRGTTIDWCLVGEPSSSAQLGDVIRTGRRGSLNAKLRINGIQGHVAYPTKAKNPIHNSMAALTELVAIRWDDGNEFFPPTTMQISNINAGTGVSNVIPGEMDLQFNFRFSTESTAKSLKSRTEKILKQHAIDYEIEWSLSGNPFLTEGGELIPAAQQSIRECCDIETELSTSGGTSDGRFIAPTGTQVVELGPKNATIHKLNECVEIEDLFALSRLYSNIMTRLLA
jgi:succinyl-diaminopimelate desuccinylase